MERTFVLVFNLICLAFGIRNYGHAYDEKLSVTATKGMPWPLPQKYSPTTTVYTIDQNSFKFVATGQSCDILDAAFLRYKSIIFGTGTSTLKFRPRFFQRKVRVVASLSVNVKNPCEKYPSLEMDESYDLAVGDTGAVINCNSVWGALRGIETFSQLVLQKDANTFVVNGTTISDFPRFQHRGMLLDTARHFLDVSIVKKNLDAMSQNKFNVFHWHIVDDQSFPYTSTSFPSLSSKGAYDQEHVYSQADIKDIIEYARLLGIRVIPEFDSPGHSLSWGKGIPDLLTKCYSSGKENGNFGPIDPSLESSFGFLSKFFAEIAGVFPDHYVHLGGDEVPFDCWKSNPNITKFMQQKKFGTDYAKLEEYYIQRLLNIINNLKKGYLIWQEVVDNGAKISGDSVVEIYRNSNYMLDVYLTTLKGYKTLLQACWYLDLIQYGVHWQAFYSCDPHNFNEDTEQFSKLVGILISSNMVFTGKISTNVTLEALLVRPDTVVEVWKGGFQAEMARVTSLGYKTLLSSCWYLNYISYGEDWPKYYACEPYNFNGTEAQKKLVIGGEVCMWAEFVDSTNVLSRIWPRASVVAERLWSAENVKDANAAAPRLEEHRCRMIKRGFPAEPVNGPGFCPKEYRVPAS